MPRFMVRCYEGGIWDNIEPRDIEAQDEREAAESVCGGPLVEAGKPGLLRAEVWPLSSPSAKKLFYVQALTVRAFCYAPEAGASNHLWSLEEIAALAG